MFLLAFKFLKAWENFYQLCCWLCHCTTHCCIYGH